MGKVRKIGSLVRHRGYLNGTMRMRSLSIWDSRFETAREGRGKPNNLVSKIAKAERNKCDSKWNVWQFGAGFRMAISARFTSIPLGAHLCSYCSIACHFCSVQFNLIYFKVRLGPGPLRCPSLTREIYTWTPFHQPLLFGRRGTDHLP